MKVRGVPVWPLGLVRVGTMRQCFDSKGGRIGGVCFWRYRLRRWDAVMFKRTVGRYVYKDV